MNPYLDLYLTFARIGVCTFGGGYAMLPILQREVVENRHWATEDELMDYYRQLLRVIPIDKLYRRVRQGELPVRAREGALGCDLGAPYLNHLLIAKTQGRPLAAHRMITHCVLFTPHSFLKRRILQNIFSHSRDNPLFQP